MMNNVQSYRRIYAYRAPNNYGGVSIMVCKIIGNLHPRVSRANHKHPLPSIASTRLVDGGVDCFPGETLHPRDRRNPPHPIFTGCHDQIPCMTAYFCTRNRVACHDSPALASHVFVLCGHNFSAKPRLNVAVQVLHELLPGNVGRGVGRVRQRAELLGEVKLEAVIGAVAPQRRAALLSLNDEVWDGVLAEACCCCQTCWACSHDQNSQLHLHRNVAS
jgi:hypothetical protein